MIFGGVRATIIGLDVSIVGLLEEGVMHFLMEQAPSKNVWG
jgi:hypothetical protein